MSSPAPLPKKVEHAASFDVAPGGAVAVGTAEGLLLGEGVDALGRAERVFPKWTGAVRAVRWAGDGVLYWTDWTDRPDDAQLFRGELGSGAFEAEVGGPLSAGGGLVAVGGPSPRVVDAEGKVRWTGTADAIALSPNGRYLATAVNRDSTSTVTIASFEAPDDPLLAFDDSEPVLLVAVDNLGGQAAWRTYKPFELLRYWSVASGTVDRDSLFVVDCVAIRFSDEGSLALASASGEIALHQAVHNSITPSSATEWTAGTDVYDLGLSVDRILVAAEPGAVVIELDRAT